TWRGPRPCALAPCRAVCRAATTCGFGFFAAILASRAVVEIEQARGCRSCHAVDQSAVRRERIRGRRALPDVVHGLIRLRARLVGRALRRRGGGLALDIALQAPPLLPEPTAFRPLVGAFDLCVQGRQLLLLRPLRLLCLQRLRVGLHRAAPAATAAPTTRVARNVVHARQHAHEDRRVLVVQRRAGEALLAAGQQLILCELPQPQLVARRRLQLRPVVVLGLDDVADTPEGTAHDAEITAGPCRATHVTPPRPDGALGRVRCRRSAPA